VTVQPLVQLTAEPWQPTRDAEEWQQHLQEALAELTRRRGNIDTFWVYYDGDHPQVWMTERLRRAFGPRYQAELQDNYVELAVDTVVERVNVTGWQPYADGGDEDVARADELWDLNRLDLEQEELYRAAEVAGRAYLIVWPNAEDSSSYDMVVNDARNVYLSRDPARARRRWACKVWLEGKRWRATLYYPDEIIRLRATVEGSGSSGRMFPRAARRFELDPDDPGGAHSMGGVPVFEFAHDKRGRSRLRSLIPIMDKINKLGANKMVTAEFLAWAQRWIMTAGELDDDQLRPSPGTLLLLDPGGETADGDKVPPTQVGQWDAGDLGMLDDSQQKEIDKLFSIGRLPRHLQVNPGVAPSGDAVRADEGPLIKLADNRKASYGATWRDVWELLGVRVQPAWADSEAANDEAVAREVAAYVGQAGMPLDVALEHVGWPEEKLEKVRAGMKAAAAREAAITRIAAQALDQGRQVGDVADDQPDI
jgi:hypothetical protein